MLQLKNFSTISSLILLSSLLAGCSTFAREPEKEIVTVTEVIKPTIAVVERPKPVQLQDVQFYVVTQKNLDEFLTEFAKKNGELVFYAISVRDYENIALNMADLRRYLLQQKEIIIYYEKAVTDDPPSEKVPEQNNVTN